MLPAAAVSRAPELRAWCSMRRARQEEVRVLAAGLLCRPCCRRRVAVCKRKMLWQKLACCGSAVSTAGVTRGSIITLARSLGYDVQEEKVAVTEAMEVRRLGGLRFTCQNGVFLFVISAGCSHRRLYSGDTSTLHRCDFLSYALLSTPRHQHVQHGLLQQACDEQTQGPLHSRISCCLLACLPAVQADEIFTTGTAVVVCSVGSLTYRGNRHSFAAEGAAGSTALELYNALTQLQTEQADDPFGWVYKVC